MKIIQISPSGFVAPYQLGICMYIKNHFPMKNTKIIGGSAGSWMAVYLASDINNDDLIHKFMPVFKLNFEEATMLNRWKNVGNFLKEEIPKYISSTNFVEDKQVLISVSKIDTFKLINEVTDNYDSLSELIQLCYLSSYIPLLSGRNIPVYKNKLFIDETFTKRINTTVDLFINPTMWGRSFKQAEYIGCSTIKPDFDKQLRNGYLDSMRNKHILRKKLLY